MDEQAFVVEQFQKGFATQREIPFVLYGLGKNTEAILKCTQGFQFVGLMDSQNTGRKFFGIRVLAEEEVLTLNPRIVIVARDAIVPVIYERIAHLQKEHGIQIYKVNGELLGQKKWEYMNQGLSYWNVSENDLKGAIDSHDYISFDIFDTLLMRKVLEPIDVFEIVERRLENKEYKKNQFKERRIEAERSLRNYPTIHQIYEEMGRLFHIDKKILEDWKRMEIETEEDVLLPRRKMIDIFRYALRQNKKIYLISDMYFSAKEIEKFLKKFDIDGYSGVLVSCDYHKGKEDGSLYDVYLEFTGGAKCLHVGDNRRSDVQKAKEKGLDVFQIYGAYEMWMASSMQTTLACVQSLEQRCILGELVWKCCEDPFAFHETAGYLTIKRPVELGHIFLGALFDEFASWLALEVKKNGIEQLLLPSRDGYLIKKLLNGEKENSFEPIYYKASRRSVSVASVQSEEDILFLTERAFQGTFGELLVQRFGVKPREEDKQKNISVKGCKEEEIFAYVLSYRKEILNHAKQERKEYLTYLDSLKLRNEKRQAIFDFVASGTVHFFMQKLLDKKMPGFYFATMNHPNGRYHLKDWVVSAYGNISSYDSKNQVGKHYLFLETIMVDGCPTLERIQDGKCVYITDGSNEIEGRFSVIQKVQEGILAYQADMQAIRKIVPGWRDERKFADELFGKLFNGGCQIATNIQRAFVNDDFFDGVADYSVWRDGEN